MMGKVVACLLVLLSTVHAYFNRLLQPRGRAVVGNKGPGHRVADPTDEHTPGGGGGGGGGSGSSSSSSSSAVSAVTTGRGRRLKMLPTAVAQGIDAINAAFIGGTVGVMSVAVMVELRKKSEDNTLESCPYCMGNGEILCASCFGMCTTSAIGPGGVACTCDVCGGRGLIMCINCKGDGRETPIIFKSKAVRDPEYAADGISIDSPSII